MRRHKTVSTYVERRKRIRQIKRTKLQIQIVAIAILSVVTLVAIAAMKHFLSY